MMAYLGCALFGLLFFVMAGMSNGSIGARMDQTFAWLHAWAPFSYLLILLVLAAPIVSVKMIASWPKHVEPENPMAKYRNGDDVIDD
jgi:hypothetical protein